MTLEQIAERIAKIARGLYSKEPAETRADLEGLQLEIEIAARRAREART